MATEQEKMDIIIPLLHKIMSSTNWVFGMLLDKGQVVVIVMGAKYTFDPDTSKDVILSEELFETPVRH